MTAPMKMMNVPPVPVVQPTVAEHLRGYLARIRGGDLGSLPAVLGLVVLCVIFSVARPTFYSAGNFANLFVQGAQVTLIAMGLVFVLLVGEIDLSAGFASGVCGAVLAIVLSTWGWPWYAAVAAALLTGVAIGALLGVLVAKLGIPSFIVTLAAFLAFQGVLLRLLQGGRSVPVTDDTLLAIENRNLSPLAGWILVGVAVAGYAAVQLRRFRNRAVLGLVNEPMGIVAARIGGLAAILVAALLALNAERSVNAFVASVKGVPYVVPLIGGLLVIGTFVLQRTSFGRHVYAVGGNAEAARRAGIAVHRIRIVAFVIAAVLTAVGGIVAASRAGSVTANSGGSNVLLFAVGAAVIGGTSLFGGRGSLMNAIVGGAVVAVIDNGMGLLDYDAGTKYMLTGVILLIAAVIDALSRRRAAATGTR